MQSIEHFWQRLHGLQGAFSDPGLACRRMYEEIDEMYITVLFSDAKTERA
jgi:hypothetical protein